MFNQCKCTSNLWWFCTKDSTGLTSDAAVVTFAKILHCYIERRVLFYSCAYPCCWAVSWWRSAQRYDRIPCPAQLVLVPCPSAPSPPALLHGNAHPACALETQTKNVNCAQHFGGHCFLCILNMKIVNIIFYYYLCKFFVFRKEGEQIMDSLWSLSIKSNTKVIMLDCRKYILDL